jgi:hypothetical protein
LACGRLVVALPALRAPASLGKPLLPVISPFSGKSEVGVADIAFMHALSLVRFRGVSVVPHPVS